MTEKSHIWQIKSQWIKASGAGGQKIHCQHCLTPEYKVATVSGPHLIDIMFREKKWVKTNCSG